MNEEIRINQGNDKDRVQETVNSDTKLQEAIRLHDQGAKGDKNAVMKSYELLKGLYALAPNDCLVEAYLGSATTLRGRDAINPNDRFKLALSGLKKLDSVLKKEPHNIEIRTLRANVCIRLPEMYFHRTETAIVDLQYLASCYEEVPGSISDEAYWKILFDLGEAYKNLNRNKEANSTWWKLLSIPEAGAYKAQVLLHTGGVMPDEPGQEDEEQGTPEKAELGIENREDKMMKRMQKKKERKKQDQEEPDKEDVKKNELKDTVPNEKKEPGDEQPEVLQNGYEEEIVKKKGIGADEAEKTPKEAQYPVEEAEKDQCGQERFPDDSMQKEELDEKILQEGIILHKAAFFGNRQAVEKAFQFFKKAYEMHPDDPVAAAYYADCLSLTGRDALDTASMFGSAIKAMKLFDELVAKNPVVMEIRLLRAGQSLRLPEAFFKRTATAIMDLEYAAACFKEGSTELSREFFWKILFILGRAYYRIGMADEGRAVWEKLLEECTDSGCIELVKAGQAEEREPIIAAEQVEALGKEALVAEGIRLHDLAVEGNRWAVKHAFTLLSKAYRMDPRDPVIEGYYGSAVALMGKYAPDSQSLFSNAIEGLKHMKKAVSRDSGNLKLRLMRARFLMSLPEVFFHMSEKAAKDLRFLLGAWERDRGALPEEWVQEIRYNLGVCYERMNNMEKARKVWRQLASSDPDPIYKSLLENKFKGSEDDEFLL